MLSFNMTAQIETYDISQFARQNLIRKTFSLDAQASIHNDNASEYSLFYNNPRFRIGGDADFNKNTFMNNDSIQSFSNISYGTNFSFQKNEITNNNDISKELYFSPYLDTYNQHRKFREDEKFVERSLVTRTNYRLTQRSIELGEDDDYASLQTSINFDLGLGKGRQEYIVDAWNACTILEHLKEKQLLLYDPSHEIITQFANIVAEAKNVRFTDPRHEEIKEYELVMQFLIENEIIDPMEYSVFAIVRDAYLYERFVSRFHGKYNSYGLSSDLRVQKSFGNTNAFDQWFIDPAFSLFYRIDSDKALSQDFQRNYYLQFEGGSRWNFHDTENINQQFTSSLSGSYFYGYYPSARTNLRLGISGTLGYIFDEEDYFTSSAYINGTYNYYVSPRFAWTVRANLRLLSNTINDFYSNDNSLTFTGSYRFY
jgi:hypothetical protein